MNTGLPKVGQIWERDGLRRVIVDVKKISDFKENDYDVVWNRENGGKIYIIWLPYWYRWSKKARLVDQ